MTSRDPIVISDSDSEPEEATFEGRAITVSRSSTKRPRTSPSSSEEVCRPTTIPEPLPVPTFEVGEPSRPSKIRKTARKRVGCFVSRPLAPRDEISDSTADIPCDVEGPRLPGPEPLQWMVSILSRWRHLEDLPSSFARHAPITGEPIELTVPTLVGVCRTILQILSMRHDEILELQSDTSRLEGEVISIYGRLDIVEARQVEDAEAARARMSAIEDRQRVMSFVLGAAVGWYVMRTIVGSFFPYFM